MSRFFRPIANGCSNTLAIPSRQLLRAVSQGNRREVACWTNPQQFLSRSVAERCCVAVWETHASRALGDVVREMTRDAATQDPRFFPVGPEEVADLQVEISRLSTPVEADSKSIVIGRHGVIVRRGHQVGLLLPQVATEIGCDATEFLALACRKAGLPPAAWQESNVSINVFEAEVFGE